MAKKPKPLGKPVVRLKLRNFRQIEDVPGEHKRRFKNIKTGQEISRREFAARAKREIVIVKPKESLTIREKRIKWFANHHNHMEFNDDPRSDDYISFSQAAEDPEFIMYERMIHDRDAEIRQIAYDYFGDLEYEYEYEDWGETPGAA